MSPVNLSEKILTDAGGWQAMRLARALLDMGRVASASYTPPILKGLVREGETEYHAGLKIRTATDIENLCSCHESRQWGKICPHSLAVGLCLIRAKATPVPQPFRPAGTRSGPKFSIADPGRRNLILRIILPPAIQPAWEKGRIMVVAEAEFSRHPVLLQALDAGKTYLCGAEDLRVIEKIRALNDGQPAGMLMLLREQFLEILKTLEGHPRVTLGKTTPVNPAALLATLAPGSRDAAEPGSSEKALPAAGGTLLLKPEFTLTVEGSLNHLGARLQASYGKRILTAGAQGRGDEFGGRNLREEGIAISRLRQAGFAEPDASEQYVLRGETRILSFFARDLPALQKAWKVSIGSRFENITGEIKRINPRLDIVRSGESWFDMTVSLEAPGGERFSSSEIQRLLQTGQNHVKLKGGKLAVFDPGMLDELQNVLLDCNPRQEIPGTYRVDRVHAGYIDAVLGEGNTAGVPEWRHWADSQRQLEKCHPIPLGSFEEILRPYQKEGVYWMNFLAKNNFSGILADEMGLGKTVQALAFISITYGKTIIICPSSLIYNWQREAARFCPDLKVLCIQGGNRHDQFKLIPEVDLVITSYPLLRRDIGRYQEFRFKTVILDEAQHIKNPDTQNAQAALELQADHRFVLTGTPMENSVQDLWSVMNFLMPGYLGSRMEFRERYELPISREASAPELSRLAKRLKPFMLRRLKKNVITEIPDKIEQVSYCQLTATQSDVYKGLLMAARAEVERIVEEDGNAGRARMKVLTALLRLRQACCDLRLLGLEADQEAGASAKLDLLDELLQEALDGGHRILIFSQFVSMLTILRDYLDKSRVRYCYLDGQTRDRGGVVDLFQTDPGIPVFLISLKAGGVGLNLTAADTVIHFDPWWNPAVEAQATDRAHRIGQDRVVTSYKLITRETVEEKILNLQLKKREMIDAMMESEEPLMTGLTLDEITGLLAE